MPIVYREEDAPGFSRADQPLGSKDSTYRVGRVDVVVHELELDRLALQH